MQEQMSNAMESAKEAAASVTERVSDFFQGNPFSTPIGRKIEMATDASMLATENWGLNMEICDFINNTADGGRDAIRAIRKRLHTQMSKNNAIVMYTLTVLETCVKNCDNRFHELVCNKEFISELVRLIGPKFDAPQVIQERVLSLIQSWNDAFHGDSRFQGVCQVYDELKAKGVEFPAVDAEATAPIRTPKRTVFPAAVSEQNANAPVGPSPVVAQESYFFADPSQPIQPTAQQLEKLRKELDIVNGNLKVLREMLSEMAPGKENEDDLQLLTELHASCKQMHLRVLDLIRCIQHEEVTCELLTLNDDFNNVFEKYDRYMSNRVSGAVETNKDDKLIDVDEQSLVEKLGALKTVDATNHNITEVSTSSTSIGAPVNEREAAEMAEWLEAQEGKGQAAANSESLLSSELDQLLQKDDSAKKN